MTTLNTDQLLGLVVAPGSPSVAVDQLLVLQVQQRLVPEIIYTRVDQLLTLLVERRGPSGALSASPSVVVGNGVAHVTITATVVDLNLNPLSGVTVNIAQDGHAVLSATSGVSNSSGIVYFTATDTVAELVTFTASGVPFTNTATVQFTAPRVDGTVYSQRGPVIAGAQIYAVIQPANLTLPPTPLLPVYADPNATQEITQPITTNGLGAYDFYADNGLFTLMVVNAGQIVQVFPDQEAGKPVAACHSLNEWCKNVQGAAIPGAQLFLLANNYPYLPTTLKKGPPGPQVMVFSDSNGLVPQSQPNISSGFGFANCYAAAGVYTLAVYLQGTLMQVYTDVSFGGVYAGPLARYRGFSKNALGQAQPNNRVLVSLQPTNTPGALVPDFPTNLASIFSDVNGHVPVQQSLNYDRNGNPVIQSIMTDGNGFFTFCITPDTPFSVSTYNQSNRLAQSLVDQSL